MSPNDLKRRENKTFAPVFFLFFRVRKLGLKTEFNLAKNVGALSADKTEFNLAKNVGTLSADRVRSRGGYGRLF